MEINCVLKTSEILKVIYALSALRTYVSYPEREIPLLSRDNSRGLRLLAGDAFSRIVVRLLPEALCCQMPSETLQNDAGDDTMSVTLNAPEAIGQNTVSAIRRVLEDAVVYETMHDIYAGTDPGLADTYGNKASACVSNISQLLRPSGLQAGLIVPFY